MSTKLGLGLVVAGSIGGTRGNSRSMKSASSEHSSIAAVVVTLSLSVVVLSLSVVVMSFSSLMVSLSSLMVSLSSLSLSLSSLLLSVSSLESLPSLASLLVRSLRESA